MQGKPQKRSPEKRGPEKRGQEKRGWTWPAGSGLAAPLLVCAGVAAVAQPLPLQPRADGIAPFELNPSVRPATIRIVLPEPALSASSKPQPTGSVRIDFDELAPVPAPASGPATAALPEPAALAAATRAATPALTGKPIALDQAAPPVADRDRLAAARGRERASYSATRHEAASSRRPESMSMVGDEDWASLTRAYAPEQEAASATDRTAALQPAPRPARALAAGVPPRLDMSAGDAPSRLATAAMPQDKRSEANRVSLDVATRLNGSAAGRVSLLIRDGANISVRLTDLLPILEPAVAPELYARLSGAAAPQGYVDFNALRAAGITVDFDDRDRLVLGTD